LLLFLIKGVYIQVDQIQVTFGSDEHFALEFVIELLNDFTRLDMYFLTYVDNGLSVVFSFKLRISKQSSSYTNKGLLGPAAEPVESAAVDKCGELSTPDPEGLPHRTHAQNDVQVVPHPFHKRTVDHIWLTCSS
jgi:hypothetical protein